ncbi:MAG: N-methyl-D-aspartate receptor NMDAR2C subunit [Burkholderiaceae bacterium]|nr:N-methyl-D-aspartate receptor NMDAR2C subunit [Burkholderiaceae bacterium]
MTTTLNGLLHISWRRTWQDLGLPGTNDALRDRLISRYAEPHRKYHTLQHLHECIAMLARYPGEPEHAGEVEMALWFHDAIYDMGVPGNEERSAQWAMDELQAAGAAPGVAERVHAMVMATRHDVAPLTADEQLLVDVDLSILGAPPARFDEYEVQVRSEYSVVPEDVFRSRRKSILLAFLKRPVIYGTAFFHDLLEARARENLLRSVASIDAAPPTVRSL